MQKKNSHAIKNSVKKIIFLNHAKKNFSHANIFLVMQNFFFVIQKKKFSHALIL
jgi:hypothetical protein